MWCTDSVSVCARAWFSRALCVWPWGLGWVWCLSLGSGSSPGLSPEPPAAAASQGALGSQPAPGPRRTSELHRAAGSLFGEHKAAVKMDEPEASCHAG